MAASRALQSVLSPFNIKSQTLGDSELSAELESVRGRGRAMEVTMPKLRDVERRTHTAVDSAMMIGFEVEVVVVVVVLREVAVERA